MGKSFYSMAVYDIQGGEKMSVKLVVGILLLVSVLLAGPAQANPKIDSNNHAYAFDIDDIDSPDIQSVQATTDAPTVSSTAIGIIIQKLRDISDED